MKNDSQRLTRETAPTGLPEWVYSYTMYRSDDSENSVVFYANGDYWIIRVGQDKATLAGWNTIG